MTNNAKRFSAAVETGSFDAGEKRCEEAETCGHAHKTISAARKCLIKKQAGSNARWYNAKIHDQAGCRV